MFEAVNNMTPNLQGGGDTAPQQSVIPLQQAEKTADNGRTTASDNLVAMERARQADQKATEEKQAAESRQVTEEILEELEQDIRTMHNVRLKFSKHDDTGRTMVKVLDRENDQVIREIPAENVLNLAAKIEEMIGVLFDKEV